MMITRSLLPIDKFLADKRLLALDMSTRQTWLTTWKSVYALPLTDAEMQIFDQIAGGRKPPTKRVREVWIDAGRRGGKSEEAAAVAIHSALFVKHKLSRGETGMVLVVAGTRDQARIVFNFIKEFLEGSPTLRREIVNATREEITLRNGIVIAVHSNSFRSVRGRTLVAVILDEVSFWRDESSANPDIEVYRAVLPSLATTNGILVGISTPYRRLGLLYQKYRDHYGQDGDDILVLKGATQIFNPTLSDETIASQRAADPTSATSEWDAEFRDDIASFLDDALIDGAVEHGRPLELPPRPVGYYRAFCDASGGTGNDSYTLAIAHKDNPHFIIDVVRGTQPHQKFDPVEVTKEYAALLKQYRISTVTGDYYGAEWVAGAWRSTGITYIRSELPKSQIYLECVPLFTRGLVRLPDHAKLLRELRLLERQCHRGGKESVDHPKNGSDDYANAVCGVLRRLSNHLGYDTSYRAFQPGFVDEDAPQQPVAPDPGPMRHMGEWWKCMPRSNEKIPGVDRSLVDHLVMLDSMLKNGWRP
jgi:hypothetical protein